MTSQRPVRRFPRGWLRVIRVVAAIVAGALLATCWYQFSVQPGARIVRAVFEAAPEVTPPSDFAAISSRVTTHPTVTVPTPNAPDAHLVIYTPTTPSSTSLPVVLWIHGGGFISSSTSTVADFAIMLADSGYVVASLDYSLAPAARYPVPVEQGNAALAYVEQHAAAYGGDPSRVMLGGDSAGAQISSELAAVQTNPTLSGQLALTPAISGSALKGVVLYCGLYDLRSVGSSGFPGLRTYLWAYTGDRNWTDYPGIDELSTVKQVTAAYPPTFITVGDADPFRTQAAELITALQTKGVPTDTLLWSSGNGLGHEYQFDYAKPQALTAFSRTLAFLTQKTER